MPFTLDAYKCQFKPLTFEYATFTDAFSALIYSIQISLLQYYLERNSKFYVKHKLPLWITNCDSQVCNGN